MYWDEQAWVSELAVSSVTPKETVPPPENQARSASDRAAAAAENEGLVKETEAKPKKRKVEASEMTKPKKVCVSTKSSLSPYAHDYRPHRRICSFGAIVTRSCTVSNPKPRPRNLQSPMAARKAKRLWRLILAKIAHLRNLTRISPENAATYVPANLRQMLRLTSTSASASCIGII